MKVRIMKMSRDKSGFGKFIAGALIGAGLGVLFAPKSGKETRAELKASLDDLYEKAKNLKSEDVKKYIGDKVTEIKKDLEDLDKEKVAKFAKEKAALINKKTDELVKYVVEKGTPVMEKTVTAIKEKASIVTKDKVKKLEKEEAKEETKEEKEA
jgi:gas vesicle protein